MDPVKSTSEPASSSVVGKAPTTPIEGTEQKNKLGLMHVLIVGSLATLLNIVIVRELEGEVELRPRGEIVIDR